jgi:glycosyltransferase involved in cell wall biosynthesis
MHNGVSVWFVIYDLLPIDYPEYFLDGISELHSRWFEIVSKFTGIIAISKTVAIKSVKLLEKYPSHSAKVREFQLGFNFSEALRIDDKYPDFRSEVKNQVRFLMVGTLEPRKSYGEVLDTFTELWSTGFNHHLTIVGKQGWKSDLLIEQIESHQNYGGLLRWQQQVSDQELMAFYAQSDYLLAASIDEGFGLPLIEGLHSGCQVVARDIPIFREVMGNYAIYFKQNSSSDLLSVLRTISRPNQKSADLKVYPVPNSWEQSFQELVTKVRDSDVSKH